MSATVFVLLVLAFAVGFICCFLIWQSADRSARLLRDSRDIQLTRIASTEVSHRLTDGAMRVSVFGLAAYYGVPVELVAEMRDAAACPSSWQPAGEEVLP